MAKIKLFESFMKDLNKTSERVNEGSENPSDYPGKFNEESEKAEGEKWKGFDKWGYPLYVGESAVKLKQFFKNSLKNGKAVVVEAKSGKKVLVAKYKNGLYYYLGDFDESKLNDTIEQTPESDDDSSIEQKFIAKVIVPEKPEKPAETNEPIIKMIPLTVYIKGKVKRYKAHRDGDGKRVKSLNRRGTLGKQLVLGYKEDIENGRIFFNGLNGNTYEYDPIKQVVRNLTDEEAKEKNLQKYKRPTDKKVFRDWLKKHDIKM
jgi:hypothetical protein